MVKFVAKGFLDTFHENINCNALIRETWNYKTNRTESFGVLFWSRIHRYSTKNSSRVISDYAILCHKNFPKKLDYPVAKDHGI